MAEIMQKGTLFDPTLVTDLVTKVQGKSTLAKLSPQTPIPFNGQKEFTFTLDSEIDVVAESGKKSKGGITLEPKTIIPIKVEYGARVSDEFMYATQEARIDILKAFNDGFAKKLARGLDLMAIHGINPRTGETSTVIGDNYFDKAVAQTVTFDAADPDANIEAAVAVVHGEDGAVTGMAMAPVFSGALAALKVNGVKQYPELGWGANPGMVKGLPVDINRTVSDGNSKDLAILGDFANMFKWGYAKNVLMEIIQYGDPDNTGRDLKGYNQVYIRAEAYLGWGILMPESFVRVVKADA